MYASLRHFDPEGLLEAADDARVIDHGGLGVVGALELIADEGSVGGGGHPEVGLQDVEEGGPLGEQHGAVGALGQEHELPGRGVGEDRQQVLVELVDGLGQGGALLGGELGAAVDEAAEDGVVEGQLEVVVALLRRAADAAALRPSAVRP